MLFESSDPPAVPLWVNGHAFLTMASAFQDVCSSVDGRVLRRTPLCAGDIALTAVDAATKAGVAWRALTELERGKFCSRLADALEQYFDHVCGLIVDETGKTLAEAGAEVHAALGVLREVGGVGVAKEMAVVAIIGAAGNTLIAPLQAAVPALLGGATVIVKPDPASPSVLVALGELSGRCGFPPGVFNVVHGGEDVVAGLRERREVQMQFV